MTFPEAYIQYLVHFHGDRDFFECHELLEDHWKQYDNRDRDSVWVGLIQLAVSLYHYRRKNIVGGIKMMDKAIINVKKNIVFLTTLKIDTEDLLKQMNHVLIRMKNRDDYLNMNIRITDEELLRICQKRCIQLGFQWGILKDFNNEYIINRHLLRDRTGIEVERYVSSLTKKFERKQSVYI
ncbi:DUF309 domain-containing protein [Heyndrickxia sp. NPDC080065]|uniref:DUF309 domain-containing protein n=1 Tax=Heyndrickxia sp. NPDC080065 TaxID=3390568 RepID=UPI003D0017FF